MHPPSPEASHMPHATIASKPTEFGQPVIGHHPRAIFKTEALWPLHIIPIHYSSFVRSLYLQPFSIFVSREMLARSLFVASVLASAMALYTPPRHANDTLLSRDDSPADQDLLASCPGGPGSSNIAHADKCTLVRLPSLAFMLSMLTIEEI